MPTPLATSPLHVVAGVLRDGAGRVLLARRHDDTHLGGLWEFPGGKREAGESPREALVRELAEELGIGVVVARPLIRVPWRYPERSVLLDVWCVDRWEGAPAGREGQALQWVAEGALDRFAMPAADRPVVTALRLPDHCLVTPDPGQTHDRFLKQLAAALAGGVRLVQLRAHALDARSYAALARAALDLCRAHGARLVLNADPELVVDVGAHGVHLTSGRLREMAGRPLPESMLVGCSCHSPAELQRAVAIGADFALLGSVRKTLTHPGVPGIGWQQFRDWVADVPMPVYALGGMVRDDVERARRHGGQGIAAIRGLWPASARNY